MLALLSALEQKHALLFYGTCFTAFLLVPSFVLLSLDHRLVSGVNPWIKVVKFEISIVIFNLTIGWLLLNLALSEGSARAIGRVVAAAMLVEMVAIALQAGRGVPSHYNMTTPFNGAVFTSMALAIAANTLALAALGALSLGPQPQMPPAVTWGIRLGILLLLMTSAQGFQIVGQRGHTVGAADGGPGLPFLRWSTIAGDLRIAHFVGMHGIQLLPLLGYLASRTDRHAGTSLVAGAFALLTAFFLWTLRQAWAGRPLLR